MATSTPIRGGSKGNHGRNEGSNLKDAHLESVKANRIFMNGPPYPQSRKMGPTDLDLLPSRRLRTQNMDSRVQPTDNPYHWEVPTQSRNSNISTWVKASWTRTNEIVRQRAGTLTRRVAVRRSHRRPVSPRAVDANSHASHRERVMPKPMGLRPFSFEREKQRNNLSDTMEKTEEEDALSCSFRRAGSKVVSLSVRQSMHSHEQPEERPRIPRTFSEILGNAPFVPTALLKGL